MLAIAGMNQLRKYNFVNEKTHLKSGQSGLSCMYRIFSALLAVNILLILRIPW